MNKGMPKYTTHKTADKGGFVWLPGGKEPQVPYCMKQPRPPWAAASPEAAKAIADALARLRPAAILSHLGSR